MHSLRQRLHLRRDIGRTVRFVIIWVALAGVARGADPATTLPAVSFARDVIPALSKLGCNGGACHGSFQGRGGFRLSLWGFDPEADYLSVVSEARGRRISRSSPVRSLVLLKPTMAMPHAGVRRLEADTESYEILRRWIAEGTPGPAADPVRVIRLNVTPAELPLQTGNFAALRVLAAWSDGAEDDVTRWALYETRSDQVAEVTPLGMVTGTGSGRTAITVAFQGQVAAIPVTVPYTAAVESASFAEANFIDRSIAAEWKKLGLRPAPLADDAEFLRRVSLDLIGTLPPVETVRDFLTSAAPDKRARYIDRLLDQPEYADYWTLKWGDLLRAHRRALGEKGLASFSGWLRKQFRENRPFDQFTRDLITAQGNLYTTGPAAFYFIDQAPPELAETTSQIFLGIRMQCARCHHHPFEVWSQDDYYGLAAFFSRVQRKDTKEAGRYGGAQSIKLAPTGEVRHPNTNALVLPRLLGETAPLEATTGDPRQALAAWITRPENP